MTSTTPQGSSLRRTSLTLLGRIQANDEAAWRQLVDLYGPLIFSWGRRGGLADEDAADVMQEVFVAVARSIRRFDPTLQGRFRGWLWTIARRKIQDFYRRTASEPVGRGGDSAVQELAQLPATWSDDSSDATRHEVRALFHRALALIQGDFQTQTWQAFWMAVVEERPTDEIAAHLGLTANGVRQAKSRVLRRLRAELGDAD